MRKKLWAAILLAGILGITGITAFAVPENEVLENEASQSDAKEETVEDELPEEEETKKESKKEPETVIPEKPLRASSPSEADPSEDENEEKYAYPHVSLEEAEINGTKGVYAYWDKYEGPGEPVGIALMTAYWPVPMDEGGKCTIVSRNIEAYTEERSFLTDGDRFRLVMPVSMDKEGEYQVLVVYIMNNEDVPDNNSLPDDIITEAIDMSTGDSVYDYTLPEEKTPAPTNVEADESGRLSWDIPEGVTWFNVALKCTDDPDRMIANTYMETRWDTSVNNRVEGFYNEAFEAFMKPGKTYFYSIQSVSPDSLLYSDSIFVDSNTFTLGESNDIIEDVLSKDGEELKTAVETQELNTSEMRTMRRDLTTNETAETSYTKLEDKYISASGSSKAEKVSGNSTIDTSSVAVVGDALNQITSIDFSRVEKDEAASEEPAIKNYKNVICVEISAEVDGEEKSELQWPILITMPAPEDIPINFLRIRHFMSNGRQETIRPRDNGDGTISFTIDHFSLFAFYEVEQSSSSSSSGGSVSGPVGVYYADGRSASAAQTGTWEQDSTGWKYRLANGSYPVSAWYQCDWNGKLLWYHFNEGGYLDSGWFTDADGNTYYLHPEHDGNFGYMYTGWNTIGGKTYFFSVQSGDGLPAGALFRNGSTPDGHTVDANGVLIQ